MTEHERNDVDDAACARNHQDPLAAHDTGLVSLMRTIREERDAAPAALEAVIDLVTPAIRQLVRRRVSRIGYDSGFAEDVVQDALARVSLRAQQCRATTDREAMGWMLAVARSALATALRREGPPRESIHDEEFDIDVPISFDESVGRRSEATPGLEVLLRLVVEVSRELSPRDALLLWMRLIAEDEWAAIGAALDISATAARRRYQRAQETMRRRIHDVLRSRPPDARESAYAWLRDRSDEDLSAHADPVGYNSRA